MPLPNEHAVLLEPTEPVRDSYGSRPGDPKRHPIKVRLTRSSGTQVTEQVVVIGEQRTTVELIETPLTRTLTTEWGIEWRDKAWDIKGVHYEPFKLAPRRFMRIDIEHKS